MHINGIIITKHSKCLYGLVGRAHVHVGYIFLNNNEEIVVRNTKLNIFL